MKTPSQINHEVTRAKDMAEINGFSLDIGNEIDIIAYKKPYAIGVSIATVADFRDVITYLAGYEQAKFEAKNGGGTA